ncbi:MAG: Nif3-like dinuclear metal center hexameric protein [Gemmatimonadaceae bacterium]
MPSAIELASYADDLLATAATPDYPNALNGLQFENTSAVRRIATAVDFSTRTIQGALSVEANLFIVHHGMFWPGLRPITGKVFEQIRLLVDHDVAVYSSHLPLDRHESLGNNVLLAKELGLTPNAGFAQHENVYIGVAGVTNLETAALLNRAQEFANSHGGSARASLLSANRRTKRWAICTGAGASAETLLEAARSGIDTLIVGEGAHWTAVTAEELGLVIIYAGHYATETLGVQALGRHLSDKFNIPWSFVPAPTGL